MSELSFHLYLGRADGPSSASVNAEHCPRTFPSVSVHSVQSVVKFPV